MGLRLTIALSLLLMSFFRFPGSAAAAESIPITPVPAMLQAYEPFALEIVTGRTDAGTLRSIDVVGNVISIKHQTDVAVDSLTPTGLMIVNIPGLPPGNYTVKTQEFGSGGYDPGTSAYPELSTSLSIAEAPPSQPIHAFYLPTIGHYFLTASESERDELLRYPNDYFLVDAGFNAWPADGPAPEAALPVCRFYSFLVNSHFYTANEGECESLRNNGAWVYEGIAFRALVPAAGTCPPGTAEVWRLYNNRFAQLDTNHRFVASPGIYRAMMADGWLGEGVAFCSPS